MTDLDAELTLVNVLIDSMRQVGISDFQIGEVMALIDDGVRKLKAESPRPIMWRYWPDECPERAQHRGPQGPNEDIAQCDGCGMPTFSKRPPGETFGDHLPDCSLSIDHDSFCQPGGSGHPRAAVIRG